MEDSGYRFFSLAGFFLILGLAWVTGDRSKLNLKTALGCLALIWGIGALTFWVSFTRLILEGINSLLVSVLSASQKGTNTFQSKRNACQQGSYCKKGM